MKIIKLSEYNELMGILIDVRNPLEYQKQHDLRSINIYIDKLLANHQRLLDRRKKYFIICNKGHLSKKAVINLTYLGYDATQVVND